MIIIILEECLTNRQKLMLVDGNGGSDYNDGFDDSDVVHVRKHVAGGDF